MSMPVHAFGDYLVGEMIKSAGTSFWRLCRPAGSNRSELHGKGLDTPQVRVQAPLESYGGHGFDGMSAVDVCVKSGKSFIACEVKLGLSNLRAADFRKAANACELSKHDVPRWKGNMIAVLSQNFPPEYTGQLSVKWDEESVQLSDSWVLIARSCVLDKLLGDGKFDAPRGMMLVSFEALAREIGSKQFNEIADKCFPKDPYLEWVESR